MDRKLFLSDTVRVVAMQTYLSPLAAELLAICILYNAKLPLPHNAMTNLAATHLYVI